MGMLLLSCVMTSTASRACQLTVIIGVCQREVAILCFVGRNHLYVRQRHSALRVKAKKLLSKQLSSCFQG